jgi:hypothetical protein
MTYALALVLAVQRLVSLQDPGESLILILLGEAPRLFLPSFHHTGHKKKWVQMLASGGQSHWDETAAVPGFLHCRFVVIIFLCAWWYTLKVILPYDSKRWSLLLRGVHAIAHTSHLSQIRTLKHTALCFSNQLCTSGRKKAVVLRDERHLQVRFRTILWKLFSKFYCSWSRLYLLSIWPLYFYFSKEARKERARKLNEEVTRGRFHGNVRVWAGGGCVRLSSSRSARGSLSRPLSLSLSLSYAQTHAPVFAELRIKWKAVSWWVNVLNRHTDIRPSPSLHWMQSSTRSRVMEESCSRQTWKFSAFSTRRCLSFSLSLSLSLALSLERESLCRQTWSSQPPSHGKVPLSESIHLSRLLSLSLPPSSIPPSHPFSLSLYLSLAFSLSLLLTLTRTPRALIPHSQHPLSLSHTHTNWHV